jgi:class 3 adenylate cyclase
MTVADDETLSYEELRAKAEYYERFADAAAGYFIHSDSQLSLNRRALGEKTLAFRVLSNLRDTIAIDDFLDIDEVFDRTLARIHQVVHVDKSVVFLEKSSGGGIFGVTNHLGFSDQMAARSKALFFEFSEEQLEGSDSILVNRSTRPTEFASLLQETLAIRFFVCVPLIADGRVFGYLLSSNDKEAYPFFPPFNQAHVETFSAIAGFLSASYTNVTLYNDLRATKAQLEEYSITLEDRVRERTEDLAANAEQLRDEIQKSEELLLNILPRQTAIELRRTGQAMARSFDHVSVMFSDIVGFSKMASRLDAQELVAELDQIFRAFDHIMDLHGLEKLKTIGDAYMCAGGIPEVNDTHAIDAVRAALECQEYIGDRRREKERLGRPFFEMRFGIHTGPVVAGVVGSRKFAYDIWGDTVNVAAFMESGGEVGRVNVSGTTYERIKDQYRCTARGKRAIKHGTEVEMYFVDDLIDS